MKFLYILFLGLSVALASVIKRENGQEYVVTLVSGSQYRMTIIDQDPNEGEYALPSLVLAMTGLDLAILHCYNINCESETFYQYKLGDGNTLAAQKAMEQGVDTEDVSIPDWKDLTTEMTVIASKQNFPETLLVLAHDLKADKDMFQYSLAWIPTS